LADNSETLNQFPDAQTDPVASETDRPVRPSPIDDVEAQMRRALSALGPGGMLRSRPDHDRGDHGGPSGGNTSRLQDRFNPTVHRRKFVQDGDVPVAYVRRDQTRDSGPVQSTAPSALAIRLQRAEADLAAQTTARQHAERAAAEAQAALRDLRTKLGHVELARTEAVEALRREREQMSARRAAELETASRQQDSEERLRTLQRALAAAQAELAEERSQRKALEKDIRALTDAKEAADRMVRVLSEDDDKSAAPSRRVAKVAAPQVEAAEDQEPVKWWLSVPTKKAR